CEPSYTSAFSRSRSRVWPTAARTPSEAIRPVRRASRFGTSREARPRYRPPRPAGQRSPPVARSNSAAVAQVRDRRCEHARLGPPLGDVGERTLDEPRLVRVVDGLGARGDAELSIDVRQGELPGLLGEEQPLRDLLVRPTRLQRLEDGELALAQCRPLADAVLRASNEVERPEDRSRDTLPQNRRKIARVDVLEDESRRATLESGSDERRI